MRVVGGAAFVARGADALSGASAMAMSVAALAMLAGACLLAGLWTPLAGSAIAVTGLWFALTRAEDPLASVLLATIGATLALVGPGAWSVDARLFGWKRIDVRERAK
jgi:uncharacterized membrane protein YphA (DoxX/SURF4 family)